MSPGATFNLNKAPDRSHRSHRSNGSYSSFVASDFRRGMP